MEYNTTQLTFTGEATPEQAAALKLHYEIIAAAQTAASSLLEMARKIKQMRDTEGYKALGFDTLDAYTFATMGMKQRQAYNYIAVAEKLPAKLIEQNAAAGITKLALLAQLDGNEQTELLQNKQLEDQTVQELKAEIEKLKQERNGFAEQLTMLQAAEEDKQTPAGAATEALPLEPVEETREYKALLRKVAAQDEAISKAQELAELHRKQAEDAQEMLDAARQRQQNAEAAQRKAEEREAEAKRKAEADKTQAIQEAAKLATEKAEAAAVAEAEAVAAEKLEAEKQKRIEAEQRAEEMAKKLETAADDTVVRFSLMFDELQGITAKLHQLVEDMRAAEDPRADNFAAAYSKALRALVESEAQQ